MAPFNPLKRFEGADSVKLKISPAYIEEEVECTIYATHDMLVSPYKFNLDLNLPSVSNPYGQSINFGYNPSGDESQENGPTLQSLVEGSESIVSNEEKSDIMSVAFLDGKEEYLNDLTGYDFYLGQLHKINFRCSHNVKHIFKFLSDYIPDADNIFIIGGKRYACEKIEASIKQGNLDKLMTGYFYEIVS